jgi:hypothetical protein
MQSHFQTDIGKQNPPKLVRFLIKNAAIGFTAAIVFVGAILAFDIGSLGTVFAQSGVGMVAIPLMTFMIGLTFASLQMGFAVMFTAGRDDDDQNERPTPEASLDHMLGLGLQPVPVKSKAKTQRH